MIMALFPVVAAMFYGLAYVFTEKTLKIVNVETYLFWSSLATFVSCLLLMKFRHESLVFDLGGNWANIAVLAAASILPSIGWVLTIIAVQNTSALYVTFAEISYPLFTLLFMVLFFGLRTVSLHIIVGGGLIMAGSFIMLYGQSLYSTPPSG